MAPGGGGKRKRGDRSYSGDGRDDGLRPSPHRPESLSLGQRTSQYPPQQQQQHQQQSYGRGGYNDRGRGNRRGGRASYPSGSQRSPIQSPVVGRPPSQSGPDDRQEQNRIEPTSKASLAQVEPVPPAAASAPADDEAEKRQPRPLMLWGYDHLVDDVIESWDASGKETIVAKGREAREKQDVVLLSDLYQELLHAALDGRLDSERSGAAIGDIIGNTGSENEKEYPDGDPRSDIATAFLDLYQVFTEDAGCSPTLKQLLEATQIPINKIRVDLDFELLKDLGLLRPGKAGNKPRGKHATQSLYRQSNYNLLREESEGYSKLITNLFTTSNSEPPTSEAVEQAVERIRGMIGAFDLDVGRVLDITMDVFAAVLVKQYRFFVKYLRASSWWPQDSFASYTAAQSTLGPLPRWALPGHEGGALTEEEREEAEKLRTQRDIEFWPRCREKGIDAFFELGGRQANEAQLKLALDEEHQPQHKREQEYQKWVKITGTLPPAGNKVAAQILGFKLRFYHSESRGPNDTLPLNLIYLAALLIKIGFITLRDLYPHLWPEDESMPKVKEQKLKEKTEKEKSNRPGGGTNALLAAGALPDDTLDPSTREMNRLKEIEASKRQHKAASASRSTPAAEAEEKEDIPEPSDQKVQLLKSLLAIGALPEALYMLGKFPWLADAFTDLPEYIHRILHHCLSKVYESQRPLREDDELRDSGPIPDIDQTGMPKGQIRLSNAPPRRTLKWAQLDKDETSEAIDYRFYWDEWADLIPVCQNVDDVFTLCSTLLNLVGVKIGQDTALLAKLARIGTASLKEDSSDSNHKRWFDLSKRLLVPSLSLTKANPGIVNEVFELLKHFPEPLRYGIYSEWTFGQTSRLPDIQAAFDQTKAEARDVLKRMSKTTIKPSARALAKVAYASPGVVFQVAISQLESYENIVDTFVECGRYFTYLAYDVLTWSLVSSLGQQGRNRIQSDGILTSKWLASLALFSGKVFKRYPTMNPLPIVQYVEYQVRKGNPADLVVLEDLIKSMAGIISDVNYSETQVVAMGGLETLKSQIRQQLMDKRHEAKIPAKRLIKPLTDSGLAGQMLLTLAQERKMCIFRVNEEDAHPKLLGNLIDQMQRSLGQYLDLLITNLTTEEFTALVPETSQLITQYGIDPSVAFWIGRKSIGEAMDQYDKEHAVQEADKRVPNGISDVKMEDSQPTTVEELDMASQDDADKMEVMVSVEDGAGTEKPEVVGEETPMNGESGETQTSVEATSTLSATAVTDSSPTKAPEAPACHPILQAVADAIKPALPEETWQSLNPAFFVTFWQLTNADIIIEKESYVDETKRLHDKIKAIKEDRSDMSSTAVDRRRKEMAALTELSDKLSSEMTSHFGQMLGMRRKLRPLKDQWFSPSYGTYNERHRALIEHCFFPRMILSPLDSRFVFGMIKFLHTQAAVNFRTMGLYDQFFNEKRLVSLIFLCSSRESEYLGRFINDVLTDLGRWHADKKVYEVEAYGPKRNFEGFITKKTKSPEGKDLVEWLSYEDFRRLLLKFHRALHMALKACFASGEYMHIRNAINVLNNVHQQFPVINWMGANLVTWITELSKSDPREDLKLAAMSLIGTLKRREKQWILPQAFSLMDGQSSRVPRSSSAKPSTPQPSGEAAKQLNPKAVEFRPSPQPSTNGERSAQKPAPGKTDAEDGEIDDVQTADAKSKIKTEAIQQSAKSNDAVPASGDAKNPATAKTGDVKAPAKDAPVAAAPRQPADLKQTSTPGQKPASIPSRPDAARSVSQSNLIPPDLPNKPASAHIRRNDNIPPKPEQRPSAGYDRDARPPPRVGMDGSRDQPVTRSSERHSGGPARPQPVDNRYSRLNDEGHSRPQRDSRPALPEDRNGRLPNGRVPPEEPSRRDLMVGQRGRESAMPPPGNGIPHHPDRAAMIQTSAEPSRDAPRFPLERHTHDRRSRGSSPARSDGRGVPYERRPPIDSRPAYDDRPSHASSYDDSLAPTGPRGDRAPGPAAQPSERFRDSSRHSLSSAPADPQYGRLRSEPQGHRQSESYGRLNAEPETPSGPRLPNGNASGGPPRTGRGALPNQPPLQSSTQPPPLQTRPSAPSGPAIRSSPRNQPAQYQDPQQPQSQSPTQSGPEVAGIHPDRLKAIQGTTPQAPGNAPVRNNGRLASSPVTNQPPQQQFPREQPPQNNAGAPPTGPADRRGDKRFSSLNSVLATPGPPGPPLNTNPSSGPYGPSASSNNGQGTSIRGRGARTTSSGNNLNSPAGSGPPTPSSSFPPSSLQGGSDGYSNRGSFGGPGPSAQQDDGGYATRRSTRQRSRSPAGRGGPIRGGPGGYEDMPPPNPHPQSQGHGYSRDGRGGAAVVAAGPGQMDRPRRGGPPRDELLPQGSDRRDSQDWRRGGRDGGGDGRDLVGRDGSLRKRTRGDEYEGPGPAGGRGGDKRPRR